MRVLIAEGVPLGHRLYFVRLLVDEARARGDEPVLALSPQVLGSPEYASTLAQLGCTVVEDVEPTDPATLSRRARALGSDVVVVLDADRIITRLARHSWSGPGVLRLLVLRSRMPERGADRLHRARVAVKRLLLARVERQRRVEVFHLVAPRADGTYRSNEIGDPVEWAAAADEVDAWRERLSPDLFWFGVFGVVTDRKNVPLVLEALERRRMAGDAVGLLVAGQIDPDVRRALDAVAGSMPLVVEDRLLGETELDAGVAAVDCVVLAHSNEGSSGILGKALSSGVRVLAAGALTLRDACEAQPAGAFWSPLDAEALAGGARQALESSSPPAQEFRSNLTSRMLLRPREA